MARIEQIRQRLGELDALLLTDPVTIRYAAGFEISDGAALIGRENAWLITDSRYIEAAREAVTGMEVLCTSREKSLYALLRELAAGAGPAIGAEEDRLSHGAWQRLEEKLHTHFSPAGSIVAGLRASKDEEEIGLLTAAQRIAERALDEVLGLIRPGMTEREVAAELVYRMLRYGSERNAFDPIVLTGAKTSMPHGVPGDAVIRPGDFVTMDFGAVVGGYCSDMTRTVAVGHATPEMREIYDIVLRAQLAGIAAARAGVTGREIDAAARDVIEREGRGAFFGHSFGHSLGLEIHEDPNASFSNDKPMPLGAFISAEPGIYLPGRFGVRIEDEMWLREDHAQVITRAPKELIIL